MCVCACAFHVEAHVKPASAQLDKQKTALDRALVLKYQDLRAELSTQITYVTAYFSVYSRGVGVLFILCREVDPVIFVGVHCKTICWLSWFSNSVKTLRCFTFVSIRLVCQQALLGHR